jgi:hypothetical protein
MDSVIAGVVRYGIVVARGFQVDSVFTVAAAIVVLYDVVVA